MSNRKYISFSVTPEQYARIAGALAKEAAEKGGPPQSFAEFARELVMGVVDIIVDDPVFSLTPCEVCGHVPGTKVEKDEPKA